MRNFFLTFLALIFFLTPAPSFSQENDSSVELRKIDEQKWKDLKEGIEFDTKKEEKEEDNTIKPMSFGGFSGIFQALQYVIIGMVVLGLGLLVAWILMRFYGKKSDSSAEEQDVFLAEEDIERVEFGYLEQALEKALFKRKYRMAVRIQYLWLLKVLYEQELIIWKKEKTNHMYVREYSSKPQSDVFKTLTLWYEKAWYGEKEINQDDYSNMEARFVEFRSYLQQAV